MARESPVNAGYTIIHGTGTGSGYNRIDVWLECLIGQQDVASNCTPVTVYFYAARNTDYVGETYSEMGGMYSALEVDGVRGDCVSDANYDFRGNKVHYLGSYSGNIYHDQDGTKTLTVSGSFTTLSSWVSGGNVSASIALPTIPRASTISATSANIGETSLISVFPKSSAYKHSVMYQFGELEGYVNAYGQAVAEECKLTATSIPFILPEDFFYQIPADISGTCTLTCRTYSGDSLVGEEKAYIHVLAREWACGPVIHSVSVKDINEKTLALTGDEKKLIRYCSTAQCQMDAAAQYGADLVSQTIGGVSGNSRDVEGVTEQILFRVQDSRGYSRETVDDTASMIDYTPVSNLATLTRDDATSGNATLKLYGSFWNDSFGAQDNRLTVTYQVNGEEPVAVEALTLANGRYEAVLQLTGLEYTRSYSVQVQVADALSEDNRTLHLQKGIPVFDWGENDFAFHVPVLLQSGLPALDGKSGYFNGDADDVTYNAMFRTDGAQNCPNASGFLLCFAPMQGDVVFQICCDYGGDNLQYRVKWYNAETEHGNGWYPWKTF